MVAVTPARMMEDLARAFVDSGSGHVIYFLRLMLVADHGVLGRSNLSAISEPD